MPSQSPGGSTEPLVTFLTFFTFSITPDVVTLNEEKDKEENLSCEGKGHSQHSAGVGVNSDPLPASWVTLAKSSDFPVLPCDRKFPLPRMVTREHGARQKAQSKPPSCHYD